MLFHHFPLISLSALKDSFPPDKVTGNPPYSQIFLSAFHISFSAWVVLIASFGLRGHPPASYCWYYSPIMQKCSWD